MKKQLSHISLHQTGKVLALLNFLLTAIILIPLGVYALIIGDTAQATAAFIGPFFYAIFTYIFWLIFGFLYNLVAKHTGGIEVTVVDKETKH